MFAMRVCNRANKMRSKAVKKINQYLRNLSQGEADKIARVFYQEIGRLNIRYLNQGGKARDIKLVLRPWLIKPDELKFFHWLIFSFKRVYRKLFLLYLNNAEIQKIMPLRPEEEEWFKLINQDKPQKYQVIFGRWDTNVSFSEKDKIKDIKFLETNTVGIGGIHYIPVVSEALKRVFKPKLENEIQPYRLGYQVDARHLLAEEIKLHARLIGRRNLNVAFVENREFLDGTVELPELTKYFHTLGINAILADPRDLRLKKKEIYYRDTPIDIIYRDSELQELIDLEKKGHNMEVLKQAFINNQVISSIAGELDHKSGFEIFSSPQFLHFFTSRERSIFKKYIPWTRLLKERKTQDPGFHSIDLIPYVLKNKNRLVIKPNRAYGGKGVVIGKLVNNKEWSGCIEMSLASSSDFVVQGLVPINEETFPLFNHNNRIIFDKFYSVSGFVVNRKSTAVLGRFSKEMVVNVARKGGIIPALLLLCSSRSQHIA
jgi:hypothetical protein